MDVNCSHPCIQAILLTSVEAPHRSPPAQPCPYGSPTYRAASSQATTTPTHPVCRSQQRQSTQEENKTTFLAPGSLQKGIPSISTTMQARTTTSFSLNGSKHTIHQLSPKSKKKTHLICHPQAISDQRVKRCWPSNFGAQWWRCPPGQQAEDNPGTAPEAGANRAPGCARQGGRFLGGLGWSRATTAVPPAVHGGHRAPGLPRGWGGGRVMWGMGRLPQQHSMHPEQHSKLPGEEVAFPSAGPLRSNLGCKQGLMGCEKKRY